MARTIEAFESSRQKTNLWLKDVADELRTNNRHQAYAALRAVLHTLRDVLPVEETAKFSGQLPLIMKGVFFDGWRPHKKPARLSKGEFYDKVRGRLRGTGVEAAPAVRAVLLLFDTHLSAGEITAIQRVVPHEVRDLWQGIQEEGTSTSRVSAEEQAPVVTERRSAPVWP